MKEIKLTQGKFTMVDDDDFEYLNQWKWYAALFTGAKTYYAVRVDYTNGKRTILMHRVILELTDRKVKADHRDHNGLNNQRKNLRSATHSQNIKNTCSRKNSTSKFLGVHWEKERNKWKAEITSNRKTKRIGRFDREIDAAVAYNKAAIEIHGEFANLNIIMQ